MGRDSRPEDLNLRGKRLYIRNGPNTGLFPNEVVELFETARPFRFEPANKRQKDYLEMSLAPAGGLKDGVSTPFQWKTNSESCSSLSTEGWI